MTARRRARTKGAPQTWVEDEDIWEKAKEEVGPDDGSYDDYWAVVTTVYKNMGGRIKGKESRRSRTAMIEESWESSDIQIDLSGHDVGTGEGELILSVAFSSQSQVNEEGVRQVASEHSGALVELYREEGWTYMSFKFGPDGDAMGAAEALATMYGVSKISSKGASSQKRRAAAGPKTIASMLLGLELYGPPEDTEIWWSRLEAALNAPGMDSITLDLPELSPLYDELYTATFQTHDFTAAVDALQRYYDAAPEGTYEILRQQAVERWNAAHPDNPHSDYMVAQKRRSATTVYNLGSEEEMVFDLPPEEAVVAAYEYSRGNMNTWDYPKPEDHPEFREGAQSVACGDWAAQKVAHVKESRRSAQRKTADWRLIISAEEPDAFDNLLADQGLYKYTRTEDGRFIFNAATEQDAGQLAEWINWLATDAGLHTSLVSTEDVNAAKVRRSALQKRGGGDDIVVWKEDYLYLTYQYGADGEGRGLSLVFKYGVPEIAEAGGEEIASNYGFSGSAVKTYADDQLEQALADGDGIASELGLGWTRNEVDSGALEALRSGDQDVLRQYLGRKRAQGEPEARVILQPSNYTTEEFTGVVLDEVEALGVPVGDLRQEYDDMIEKGDTEFVHEVSEDAVQRASDAGFFIVWENDNFLIYDEEPPGYYGSKKTNVQKRAGGYRVASWNNDEIYLAYERDYAGPGMDLRMGVRYSPDGAFSSFADLPAELGFTDSGGLAMKYFTVNQLSEALALGSRLSGSSPEIDDPELLEYLQKGEVPPEDDFPWAQASKHRGTSTKAQGKIAVTEYGPEDAAVDDDTEYHIRLSGCYLPNGVPPTDLMGLFSPELLARVTKVESQELPNMGFQSSADAVYDWWPRLSEAARISLFEGLAETELGFLAEGADLLATLRWPVIRTLIHRMVGGLEAGEELIKTYIHLPTGPTEDDEDMPKRVEMYLRVIGTRALAAVLEALDRTAGWEWADVSDGFGWVADWYAPSLEDEFDGVYYKSEPATPDSYYYAKLRAAMLPRVRIGKTAVSQDVLADIIALSSGTMATLTGEHSYEILDRIHQDWVQAVINSGEDFSSWAAAWKWYEELHPEVTFREMEGADAVARKGGHPRAGMNSTDMSQLILSLSAGVISEVSGAVAFYDIDKVRFLWAKAVSESGSEFDDWSDAWEWFSQAHPEVVNGIVGSKGSHTRPFVHRLHRKQASMQAHIGAWLSSIANLVAQKLNLTGVDITHGAAEDFIIIKGFTREDIGIRIYIGWGNLDMASVDLYISTDYPPWGPDPVEQQVTVSMRDEEDQVAAAIAAVIPLTRTGARKESAVASKSAYLASENPDDPIWTVWCRSNSGNIYPSYVQATTKEDAVKRLSTNTYAAPISDNLDESVQGPYSSIEEAMGATAREASEHQKTSMISLEEGDFGTYLVVDEETGEDILIQTDTDFPGLASSFGWGGSWDDIDGAIEFLDAHIGDTVEDPGYFASKRTAADNLDPQPNDIFYVVKGYTASFVDPYTILNPGDAVVVDAVTGDDPAFREIQLTVLESSTTTPEGTRFSVLFEYLPEFFSSVKPTTFGRSRDSRNQRVAYVSKDPHASPKDTVAWDDEGRGHLLLWKSTDNPDHPYRVEVSHSALVHAGYTEEDIRSYVGDQLGFQDPSLSTDGDTWIGHFGDLVHAMNEGIDAIEGYYYFASKHTAKSPRVQGAKTAATGYAWIVTKDLLGYGQEGTVGPQGVPDELVQQLQAGDGVRWRVLDDDGEVYYEGRLTGDYDGIEPLVDWGTPNAGATEIQFWTPSGWEPY